MIRNKLREKNGVSIFMGLIFLLVCVMVGSVALTASTAAAGKLAQQRENEQDYLNAASAARLVRDRICELTYTYKVTKVTTKPVDGEPSSTSGSEKKLETSGSGGIILEEELKSLCESLVEKSDSGEKSFCIDLKPAAGAPDVEWKTVYGSVSVKADGKIMVELWLGDEEKAKGHNRMKIEFCPNGPVKSTTVNSVESPEGGLKETKIVTTVWSWPEGGCTITKGY